MESKITPEAKKAVREAIKAALIEHGFDNQTAHTAAIIGMFAVNAEINGTEFSLSATTA